MSFERVVHNKREREEEEEEEEEAQRKRRDNTKTTYTIIFWTPKDYCFNVCRPNTNRRRARQSETPVVVVVVVAEMPEMPSGASFALLLRCGCPFKKESNRIDDARFPHTKTHNEKGAVFIIARRSSSSFENARDALFLPLTHSSCSLRARVTITGQNQRGL